MKINYLIKTTPFLPTLLIIIFLSISNQKEYTKLKILIWNTPSLTLGQYLSVSIGTGFLLSYLITTNLPKLNQKVEQATLKYKEKDTHFESDDFTEIHQKTTYDYNLIERDVKDPSPTLNANFRIIGRTEDRSNYFKNYNNVQNETPIDSEDDMTEEYTENYKDINQTKAVSNDWTDESYSRW